MNKLIISSLVIFILLIAGAFTFKYSDKIIEYNSADFVSVKDGTQYINLKAKGGYNPRKLTAQANLPTVLRFETATTFDCSASVRLPSINKSQLLPMTGVTDINIGTSTAGVFKGTCGMGMYSFEIDFKS